MIMTDSKWCGMALALAIGCAMALPDLSPA